MNIFWNRKLSEHDKEKELSKLVNKQKDVDKELELNKEGAMKVFTNGGFTEEQANTLIKMIDILIDENTDYVLAQIKKNL